MFWPHDGAVNTKFTGTVTEVNLEGNLSLVDLTCGVLENFYNFILKHVKILTIAVFQFLLLV